MKRVYLKPSLRQSNRALKPDPVLLWTIGLIVVLGLLFLASASSVYSYKNFDSPYYLVIKQLLVGVIPGGLAFFILSRVDYRWFQNFTYVFFAASVVLLLSVFIPGLEAEFGTTQSWVQLFGFSFQPSELVKLTFLLFLASWISKRGYSNITKWWEGMMPFLFYLGVISLLIIKQPDFGTLMIVFFMALTVFFVAGARMQHLATFMTAAVLGLFYFVSQRPYLSKRFQIFLDPLSDTQNFGYQVYQAFLAIGSGGIFGRGFGKSQQKFFYLPEVSSDSIFAIIAEEMGFAVVVFLIGLFLVLMYRGIKIAIDAPDPFGRFLAAGIVSWITFQTFLNIGVMTGLAPLTGIPLPFISLGGTSMLVSLAAMGILANISTHRSVDT